MNKQVVISILTTASLVAIQSCVANPERADAPVPEISPTKVIASPALSETGTLVIRANGEDFVQQGFVSKNGWQINFDHLFGAAETPLEDDLNQGALGFEPLATIAPNGQLDADLATLKENLSEEDYNKLLGVIPSLGHVGEGYCEETPIS
jgi:hypothetical protein